MVPSRSKLHINFLELRWSFGPLSIPRPLVEQYCCYSYRQHSSGCLYKGRRGMKSGPLCALLWRILVKPVFPPSLSPGHTFSRISVSGVSMNGKHEKLELDLEQVFDLVGFQLHPLYMLFNPYRCIKKGEVLTQENTLQGEPWSLPEASYTLTFWN